MAVALLQQMRKVGSVQEGDQVNILGALDFWQPIHAQLGLDIS